MEEEDIMDFDEDIEMDEDQTQFSAIADTQTEDLPDDSLDSNKKWSRSAFPLLDPRRDPIQFQQIDIDHYITKHREGMSGKPKTLAPIMRIYGITESGNSVMAHVHGFYPYFYVEMPKDFKKEQLANFQRNLDKKILSDISNRQSDVTVAVLSVEIVKKQNIYG